MVLRPSKCSCLLPEQVVPSSSRAYDVSSALVLKVGRGLTISKSCGIVAASRSHGTLCSRDFPSIVHVVQGILSIPSTLLHPLSVSLHYVYASPKLGLGMNTLAIVGIVCLPLFLISLVACYFAIKKYGQPVDLIWGWADQRRNS